MVDALAVKDDEGRDSLRKVSGNWQVSFDPKISEWGNPTILLVISIILKSERRELKHLSTYRKRNQKIY